MNMLGEVVFCVDCDRARVSHLQSVPVGATEPPTEPPRRMAVKQDANRDPLCAACLDLRQAKRRAEFMLHEGRAPVLETPPSPAATGAAVPRKKVEFVRIVRSRPQEADVVEPAPAPAPRKKRATQKVQSQRLPPPRKQSANYRALERKFLMLVLEIGFLRAQELLDELKRSARVPRI